ncbi:hypothetical protein [Tunturiibacter gelidiferens]
MGKEGEGILVYYCIPQRDMFTLGLKETCGNDVTSFAIAIDCHAQL